MHPGRECRRQFCSQCGTYVHVCIYVLSIQYFIGASAPLSDHRQLIDISSSAHVSEHWNIDNNITLSDSKYTIKNGER